MNPQQPSRDMGNIQGEPVELDVLIAFAEIDSEDIESAAQWWDDTASPEWVGALDSEPVE